VGFFKTTSLSLEGFKPKNFEKRGNSAYPPKVKPSAGPRFLSKKTSRDREVVLKNSLKL